MERQPTILVVDDAAENIALLTEILKTEYRVLAATSGQKALAAAREKKPDLILLDVMMPDMDGLAVCRILKSEEGTRDIPVIFVTAKSEMSDEEEGLSSGAIDYITKPLWPPIVKARVRIQLDLRAAHRRIAELNDKFSSYLSPELSDSIKKGVINEDFTSIRKKLTVFFSDIAGFTRLAESMDPVEMTALLNEYFEAMNDIVARHGGTLDKYIGDAILVFFGDPRSRGPAADAAACVSMALEMQEKLALMRRTWKQQGLGESIQVRMGISTGYVTVGNYGSRHKREYTIIGPPVNLANRLESQAEVGSILISEETWQLVHDRFECIQVEPMQLKGISHPVRPYRVVGSERHKWREFEAGENWLRINPHLLREEDKAKLELILRDLAEDLERSREKEKSDE